ncbi:hypothetical protein D3C86_2173290 [compost metagenome]
MKDGGCKVYKDNKWQQVGSSPTRDLFVNQGMDSINDLYASLSLAAMSSAPNGSLGSGVTYKVSIDIDGGIEITKIGVS